MTIGPAPVSLDIKDESMKPCLEEGNVILDGKVVPSFNHTGRLQDADPPVLNIRIMRRSSQLPPYPPMIAMQRLCQMVKHSLLGISQNNPPKSHRLEPLDAGPRLLGRLPGAELVIECLSKDGVENWVSIYVEDEVAAGSDEEGEGLEGGFEEERVGGYGCDEEGAEEGGGGEAGERMGCWMSWRRFL